jgi:hypothetical protein
VLHCTKQDKGYLKWFRPTVQFTPDGKFVISGCPDNTFKMWEISTGNVVRTFTGHSDLVRSISISPDGKTAISCSMDKSIKIWDLNSINEIATLYSFENGWFTVTRDMYFDCSKEGNQSVSTIFNNHGYNIDQFALKFNRPDIILKRLGNKDSALIQHYYNQYKKRLHKAGFCEEQLLSEIHVPVATITDVKQIDKNIDLKFVLNDDKYNLKKYNLYVNDVPLFGAYGKDIAGKNHLEIEEYIELTNGTNKIEISCINEKGAEGFRSRTFIEYKQNNRGNLYFLGFGVSKYQNQELNLQFADKDAMNLASVFQKMSESGNYDKIYCKTLLNDKVTTEFIKSSKDFLKNAKPDDTFILFIAGHGMHDKDAEATYYYLTYGADVNNLKATAADFESIEDLLQGIPPRNKLFLMDACESGEIDEDEVQTLPGFKNLEGIGIASRGFKKSGTEVLEVAGAGTSRTSAPPKRSYLYQKDRYIYNDLVRRSGAIVFSSSKGGELSYERSDIENGLFTEAIIKALTTTEADKDNNGVVSTDELRDFVANDVAKASGDLQHPTVDRDNIYQKFGFGVK